MFQHAHEKDSIQRIAVLRALQLGDLLCAVPAFRALRATFPRARISLIGLPWARQLVDHLPGYVDELIEFPGFPGIPEAPFDAGRLTAFVADMQRRRFDLAVQLHGSGLNSNAFVELLGARWTIGSYPPGDWTPDPATHVLYTGHSSEIERCLAPLRHVGIPVHGEELEFTVTPGDRTEVASLSELRSVVGRAYVCLHPGARHALRRWPVDRFVEVGRALAADGWPVVLTGTAGEAAITDEVATALGDAAIDVAGRTSLGALAALIEGSRLLVANDTGVGHLAEALRTPSVIVFTHTDPDRWAAPDRALHRVVASDVQLGGRRHDGEAHRCLADACTLAERSGVGPIVGDIPVESVLREVDELLNQESARGIGIPEAAHVA